MAVLTTRPRPPKASETPGSAAHQGGGAASCEGTRARSGTPLPAPERRTVPIPQLIRRAEQLDRLIEDNYEALDAERDHRLVSRLTDATADLLLDLHAIRCELMLPESEPV